LESPLGGVVLLRYVHFSAIMFLKLQAITCDGFSRRNGIQRGMNCHSIGGCGARDSAGGELPFRRWLRRNGIRREVSCRFIGARGAMGFGGGLKSPPQNMEVG